MRPKSIQTDPAQLRIIRSMTPQERLIRAMELGETTRALLREGIRHRHPDMSAEDRELMYRKQLARCQNANY